MAHEFIMWKPTLVLIWMNKFMSIYFLSGNLFVDSYYCKGILYGIRLYILYIDGVIAWHFQTNITVTYYIIYFLGRPPFGHRPAFWIAWQGSDRLAEHQRCPEPHRHQHGVHACMCVCVPIMITVAQLRIYLKPVYPSKTSLNERMKGSNTVEFRLWGA